MKPKEKKNKKDKEFLSELRFDLVSSDWVVISPRRRKRPRFFKEARRIKVKISKKKCPFCNIKTQELPLLIYVKGKKILPAGKKGIPSDWTTVVVPNKYPAFFPYHKLEKRKEGEFYQIMNAVGFCELVITRDHERDFYRLKTDELKEVIDAYQERYLSLKNKRFVRYVSIFQNYGVEAGASQPHPHSQIITTPLIDADLRRALSNSEKYFKEKNRCLYCQMNKWEMRVKKRIVFENEGFLVICPFASKVAFQMIISPKKHTSYFEEISEEEKWQLAEAFQTALKKLYKGLGDPAYNFYLHTSPCDGKNYFYYHWHWTIIPKTSIFAGFEIGTRMEISAIRPEEAADYLRKQ